MSAHDGPKLSRKFMDRREWVKRAKDGKPPKEATLRKVYSAEITKAQGEGEAAPVRYTFTLSTANPDRYRDVVDVEGWETENYLRSGAPVMWAHDYTQLPVGKAVAVRAENGALVAEMEFAPAEFSPMAGQVKGLVDAGFLKACSVGFAPLEHSFDEERGGFNFMKQELLEFSIVPIPANPDATLQARAAAIDAPALEQWVRGAQDVLGSESVTVSRSAYDAATQSLGWDEEAWSLTAEELKEYAASGSQGSGALVVKVDASEAMAELAKVKKAVDELAQAAADTSAVEPTEEELIEILDDSETDLDSLEDGEDDEADTEETDTEALSPEVALEVDLDELGAVLRQSLEAQWKPLLDTVSKVTGHSAR